MGWMVVFSGSGPILLHKNLPHYYHEHTDLSDSFVHLFIHSSSAECPLYSRYWAKQKHTSRKFQLKLIRATVEPLRSHHSHFVATLTLMLLFLPGYELYMASDHIHYPFLIFPPAYGVVHTSTSGGFPVAQW